MKRFRSKRIWLAGLLWAGIAAQIAVRSNAALAADEVSRPAGRVITVQINQAITRATQEFVQAALERGKSEHAEAVVFLMDTPGGYLDATRGIVQALLASEVPVVVYVTPAGARAGSAGVFITMAANVAAMHASSNIGAAHPVTSNGGDVEQESGKDMAKKIENDTAAFARGIAKARGRNEEWAENAVRLSVSVTAEEALKLKVIDLLANDTAELLRLIDGRKVETAAGKKVLHTQGATQEPFEMSIRQELLTVLADPNIAALLMLLGMVGIGLELYHPGSIYPGAIGAVALLLGLLATQVIPVNVGAVVLLAAGVALLIAESYVSVHGAAGLGGAICLVLGTLLFINKSSPDYRFDPGFLTLSPLVIWPTPIALALMMAFVALQVARTRARPLLAGVPGLIGERGEALTEVTSQGGEVFVHGEYWKARAAALVLKGARVRVVAVEGLVVTVVAETAAT